VSDAVTRFVVCRLNWRPAGRSGAYVRLPGEAGVASFDSATDADADARAREADARRKVSPFRCGAAWAERSHLPEAVFCDFLRDVGIDPPVSGEGTDWVAWWDATAATLTDAHRDRVWEGLDKVRFYRVEERLARPVAFAVVRVLWNYNDQWYYPGDEGGEVTAAYRSRERAETECERRNTRARKEWRRQLELPEPGTIEAQHVDRGETYPFDMENRLFPGQAPFGPPVEPPPRDGDDEEPGLFALEEVPFFEVVEFELGGPV
jgi:hypothetical protein